jgi:GNAT superfamily N-acetyltransferase
MLGRRDVLRTIVPLKMLAASPDAIQAQYHEDGASYGALLLPAHVSPFDWQTYPSCDDVVLLSVTHPRIAQALLARVGGGCALVFRVYEIGGVYSLPEARRKGYARKLVETALHTLVRGGARPCEQVPELNQPSIRLAEAIGLEPFVTTEHCCLNTSPASPGGAPQPVARRS